MQLSDTAAPSQPGSPCDSSTSGDREKFLLKEISLKVETSKGLNSIQQEPCARRGAERSRC